jgi:predicted Zn-ribbon and HTH transcriptional regulator
MAISIMKRIRNRNAQIATPLTNRNKASDLLIPDLASCRDCHLGATAAKTKKIVPSSCAMCHSYHVPAGQWSPNPPDVPKGAKTNVATILGTNRR